MKYKHLKSTLCSLLTSTFLSIASPQLMANANIVFINLDAAGEGFNDPTPVTPVTGNTGTTLGQQRQNVFLAAMQAWGNTLNSAVDIRVGANFDPQFCTANSAVLGSAGPETAHRDFPGAVPGTWYGQALANSIAGVDLAAATNDIGATFNSDIDNNCFSGGTWDYQIPSAGSPLSLYSVVLHELAHGLNFLSFVDGASGTFFLGFPDIYTSFLLDQGTNTLWLGMSDAERAASAIGGNLFWTGSNAKTAATDIPLAAGQDSATQNIKMYTPNPLQTGSSVSHWDTTLSPNELMEPVSTTNPLLATTTGALQDMGWDLALPPQADISVTQAASANLVTEGNTFTYTITIQNDGPDAASNVIVSDILPSCVSFLSTSGGCTEDPNGVPTCTLGDFPASTMDSYDILVDTTGCPAGSIINQASVSSDTSDPDANNNDVTLSVNIIAAPLPSQADLSISQVDSIDPATAGNNITYTITVNNAGSDMATNIQVSDVLPIGTAFVSSTGCNNDPAGAPTCNLNDIAANASAQFTLTVNIDLATSGMITNTASVSSATNDPNLANNQASENTTVLAAALLGDIDLDGCIGRADITQLVTGLRANTAPSTWDFNGDGLVSRADARSLVQLYTNPNGTCP